jgi:ubiquinone/menaquinone biosynthesis C-methylase UbiE
MDLRTKKKWDRASSSLNLFQSYGAERRWAPVKQKFFRAMQGKVLFVGVGTGLDIPSFPPNRDIIGIDISDRMLARATSKARMYRGRLELRQLDVHDIDFAPGTFDQVFTSCTFCSVPNPVRGLEVLRRVLKPGGELRMFEHTGSGYFPFNCLLRLMNPVARLIGPEMSRDTVGNVVRAGFQIVRVRHAYLDVLKTIHAVSPA